MNKVNRRFHAALHVLTVSVLLSSVAYAHHGTAGRYEDQLSEISGTVIQLMFINPHALLAVEVEDEAGNPVRWMAEFNNVSDDKAFNIAYLISCCKCDKAYAI